MDFASKYENLAEMLTQLILLSSESGDRVVRPGESCLRLSTIHQSKGLEYPHVFIIGLADGLFPNKRAIEGEGDLEEEEALYVASTRAERSLHLIYLCIESKWYQIRLMQSRFLKELPQTGYEIYNVHSQNAFGQGSDYRTTKWDNFGKSRRNQGFRKFY